MTARSALFASSFLVLLTACQTTCEDACEKLIDDCGAGYPSYSVKQCAADCGSVQAQYEEHDYLEPQLTAFETQLDCIDAASCEELLDPDAPACYNSGLYAF